MDAITYYITVNIAFAFLFGIYAITLRKETGFHGRRAWLLATPFAALVIPFFHASTSAVLGQLAFELPEITIEPASVPAPRTSWTDRLILVHYLVTALLLFLLAIRVVRTMRALRRGTGEAGSFLGRVHVPMDLPRYDHETILAHEQVHVREKHSIDVLVYEVLSAFCWSMPLWRIALREVRLVHEHIADRQVHDMHADYPTLLLAQGLRTSTRTLHHSFSSSTLKTRITMLYNNRSPRHTRTKLLLAVPALLLSAGLVSWRISPTPAPPEDAIVFAGSDTPAEFPGGTPALMKHLSSTIRYPEKAVADGVEGTVYVVFNVRSNGAVSAVQLKRGVRADLDAEAMRVVAELPDWKPATSNGKAVNSEVILPIAFALTSK